MTEKLGQLISILKLAGEFPIEHTAKLIEELYSANQAGYVKLAEDQTLPSSGKVVPFHEGLESFEAGYHLGQERMVEEHWRKVILELGK